MAQQTTSDGNNSIDYIVASLPEGSVQHMLEAACQDGPMVIVSAILLHPRVYPNASNTFTYTAMNDQWDIVSTVVTDPQR
jgi:hypothetical protein